MDYKDKIIRRENRLLRFEKPLRFIYKFVCALTVIYVLGILSVYFTHATLEKKLDDVELLSYFLLASIVVLYDVQSKIKWIETIKMYRENDT